MRTIERTGAFRRDFKREKKGRHRHELDELLVSAVSLLAEDSPLTEKYRDHCLSGNWADHQECHLKPDLLLTYRKPDAEVLQLVPGFAQRTVWLTAPKEWAVGDQLLGSCRDPLPC